jgi:hypothetical protein
LWAWDGGSRRHIGPPPAPTTAARVSLRPPQVIPTAVVEDVTPRHLNRARGGWREDRGPGGKRVQSRFPPPSPSSRRPVCEWEWVSRGTPKADLHRTPRYFVASSRVMYRSSTSNGGSIRHAAHFLVQPPPASCCRTELGAMPAIDIKTRPRHPGPPLR